jgi:ASC-1-like (ASCH) protein
MIIDPKYAEFVGPARAEYIREGKALSYSLQRVKKAFSRIKYYDMLEAMYQGKTIHEVAEEQGKDYRSVYSSLHETQKRVENFAKRKGLV